MVFQLPGVKFDLELIRKYDTPTPRYTSYPPATELAEEFTARDFQEAIVNFNHRESPLSLYFHIPFCQSPCYFCGCNVVISKNKNIVQTYLEYLVKEIKNTASLIKSNKKVVQIHWGGGTPNYLNLEQVQYLWQHITQYFDIDSQAEISLEINPKYVDRDYILFLRKIGFNRISFGVQDFNPQVQVAVNRVQKEEMLFDVRNWIKEARFESVNVDLIYGLPHQTLHTFEETVKKIIQLNPDRIAVFNFAYVPWVQPIQKKIPQDALPLPQQKLEILQMTIEKLNKSGYLFIGMDHFAKPNDELAQAQSHGNLKRNFQGYTTKAEAELLGFGATSVSMLKDAYAQNYKKLKDYYQAIDAGVLPVSKGIKLSWDDSLRREVIMCLMSGAILNKAVIEDKYEIIFDEYFSSELDELKPLQADGLVELCKHEIKLTEVGRLLVRNIAFVFDSYKTKREAKFSRAI